MKNMKEAVEEFLESAGKEVNLSSLNKACRKAKSVEEAVKMYLSLTEDTTCPEQEAFCKWDALNATAWWYAGLRSECGEGTRAEDLADAIDTSEVFAYTRRIADLYDEAVQYEAGAKEWARLCRVELKPWPWF